MTERLNPHAASIDGSPTGDGPIAALLDRLRERDIRIALNQGRLSVNAPKGVLDDELRATIVERRAEIIAALESSGIAAQQGHDSVRRIGRAAPLPVSSAQQRLWFLDQLDPGLSHNNIGCAVRCSGPFDLAATRQAIDQLIERHESFRTRISQRDGRPRLQILDTSDTTIEFVDISATPAETREAAARKLVESVLRKPFDIARGALAAFMVIRLAADEHMLVFSMHHIVSDGWSMSIVFNEIWKVYNARVAGVSPDLKPLQVDYVDYAAFERERTSPSRLADHLAYWRTQLQGAPALLELPTDRPRPAKLSYRGSHIDRYFDNQLIETLKTLSLAQNATLFMTLLAGWLALMHRYSGQDDIVVGTPVADRDLEAFESLIGCMVNNIALRSRLDDNPTFVNFLRQVKQTTLDAFDHRELPFDTLVGELNPDRNLGHAPIFQVFFTLMSFPAELVEPAGLALEGVEASTRASRFDLTAEIGLVQIGRHKGKLHARYEYDSDLFDRETIERLHDHFHNLLSAIAADPSLGVQDLPLMPPASEQLLLAAHNATAVEHDRTRCVHHLIEATARATPDAPSVTAGEVTLSYRALDQGANRLARLLARRGFGPGMLVAVCLDRTSDLPLALLAVLKAGAAYVPLDPAHPKDRLKYTIEDAGVVCVITLRRFSPLLEGVATSLLFLDESRNALSSEDDTSPGAIVQPGDLAYVIYTSGSTGLPKGVQVEHRNVVAFLEAMRREPGLAARDSLLAVTTVSFDIAGLEIWLPLSVGAGVVIASSTDVVDAGRLIELMETHGITVMQATPATWQFLCDDGWTGRRDLRVLCGGEALPRELAAALIERAGEVWNMYGPTETTIWSTISRVTDPSHGISIGRPIANTRAYVLDPAGRPTPIGVRGELCIGGEGVTRGYRNRLELTAKSFVTLTLADGVVERIYRTGDLARWRNDRQLEWLGRRDQQVKVRGYRIELGEIEAVLASQPGVSECVVIAREIAAGDTRLLAYVTVSKGASFDADAVRAALRSRLPEYMIPMMFAVLEALPLTPTGKIDREALPAPPAPAPHEDRGVDVLMTPEQRRVAEIWRELLRVDRVGLHDNFFDLGGHSLLLIRLRAALKRQLGSDFSLVEMFQRTTVAAQAERHLFASLSLDAVQRGRTRAERQGHV
jgi:amino acid adenylation domain-containing protein